MLSLVTTWVERSPVPAAMLNPALLAAVSAAAAEEYTRLSGDPMPFAYAYLVAPLVLHRDTRDALPRRIDSYIATWLTRHPALAAGFPARARSLTEPVREGVRFGLATGALDLSEAGPIRITRTARPACEGWRHRGHHQQGRIRGALAHEARPPSHCVRTAGCGTLTQCNCLR
jgi:hypothetical protein